MIYNNIYYITNHIFPVAEHYSLWFYLSTGSCISVSTPSGTGRVGRFWTFSWFSKFNKLELVGSENMIFKFNIFGFGTKKVIGLHFKFKKNSRWSKICFIKICFIKICLHISFAFLSPCMTK